ncbi:unnamed protein product [Dovyalis caffra]|uniref:Uncharacterized protein n=1 Tax=Dovyalis caffra TaxID=77055 RepID=A0AAV1R1B8_9ROSI|nr:unnamed protein product [Dovyalis caffra]
MISLSIHDYVMVLDDLKRKVQCMHVAIAFGCCSSELFRKQIEIVEAKGKSLARELDQHGQYGGDSQAPISKEFVEFFLEMGIVLRIKLADLGSPSFQKMLGEITSDELEGGMLEEQLKNIVQEKLDQKSQTSATTSYTILMDEWINEKG